MGAKGVNLLLVAAVFALAHVIAAWLAAVLVGGVILVQRHGWVHRMAAPRHTAPSGDAKNVTEDMQWVKERLA